MKKKMFSLLTALLLVAITACIFVACNNDKNNDDDALPEITLNENMTIDEIKNILSNDVKNFEITSNSYKQEQLMWEQTYKVAEEGYVFNSVTHNSTYDSTYYKAEFYEGTDCYSLNSYPATNEKDGYVVNYRGYNYDFSSINSAPRYTLDYCLESYNDGVTELTIKDNQLIFDDSYDALSSYSHKVIISNFNKTELNISEVFGDYKSYVEKGDALNFVPLSDDDTKCTLTYAGKFLTCVEIPEIVNGRAVVEINGAFNDCAILTDVTIPNSVTSIGCYSFSDCTSLTSITIPDSVTTIGDDAFSFCKNLTNVTLSNNIKKIDYHTFSGCTALTNITIPNGVTEIYPSAFEDCTNLSSVIIPDSVTSVYKRAFENTVWYNNQPDGVVYIGKVLYKYKGTMPENTSIEIKNDTVSITDEAFAACNELISVTIPNGVTEIGENAFAQCFSLTSIIIPESVYYVGLNAFSYCVELTSVTIKNSHTLFRDSFYYNCPALSEINYNGNIDDWQLYNNYLIASENYVVNCTDGTINVVNGEETITYFTAE